MIHQLEILEDILCRLPAKSIGRFRCVSKSWKSLLSQPHFIKTHLNRIKQHPTEEQSIMLIGDHTESLYSVQLDSAHQLFDEMPALVPTRLKLDNHRFVNDILFDSRFAFCDGLAVVEDVGDKLLLVNPTTWQIKVLPTSPYALDRRHSESVYGIGYDSLTDDYKIVSVSYYTETYYQYHILRFKEKGDCDSEFDDMSVNVYSVKNGTWKRVDRSPYDHASCCPAAGVYVDGRVHWLAHKTSVNLSVIIAFDFGEEKFREVPPPSSIDCDEFLFGSLVILQGCLGILPPMEDPETGVFVMREYNVEESWTKFAIADYDKLDARPVCSLGKEQIVFLKSEYTEGEKYVTYNMEEGTFKDIVVQGVPNVLRFKGTFVESLLSPHHVYGNQAENE